jgi:Tfp pilus assembly protein PilE
LRAHSSQSVPESSVNRIHQAHSKLTFNQQHYERFFKKPKFQRGATKYPCQTNVDVALATLVVGERERERYKDYQVYS